jgi:hypothetical protein
MPCEVFLSSSRKGVGDDIVKFQCDVFVHVVVNIDVALVIFVAFWFFTALNKWCQNDDKKYNVGLETLHGRNIRSVAKALSFALEKELKRSNPTIMLKKRVYTTKDVK